MKSIKEIAAIESAIVGGIYIPVIAFGMLFALISWLSPSNLVFTYGGIALAAIFGKLTYDRIAKWRRDREACPE